jgi:hypothetical protein
MARYPAVAVSGEAAIARLLLHRPTAKFAREAGWIDACELNDTLPNRLFILRKFLIMKYVLGFVIAAVAAAPAFAIKAVPAPDLATGLPAVVGVIGAYAVTRWLRKR